MNRINRSILLFLFFGSLLGLACHRSKGPTGEVSTAPPTAQAQRFPASEVKAITDPTCCGLVTVGNQGIDRAWNRFTADGRYRLALKEDIKGPARKFGSDSLNSIFAYCWGQLGYDSTKDHLAAIVVDTRRNDANRFGLIIFSAPKNGEYQPYWLYQGRDLSRSVVWTATGDLMFAEYREDGSREVSYVRWDDRHRGYVAKSNRRPA